MTIESPGEIRGFFYFGTMNVHTPYEYNKKHPCDFIVKYRVLTEEEGGRKAPLYQGYRPDFLYAEDQVSDGLYCIYPEFLDDKNEVITDLSKSISPIGKAKMWILQEKFHEYHKNRLRVGSKGYFMEVSKKIAECEVIELVYLKS